MEEEEDEESMLVTMATTSLSLQKFLPSQRFQQSCPAQVTLSQQFRKYIERGHNTSRTLQGEPLLHFAIKNGLSLDTVYMLLRSGVSPNDLDSEGYTAFHVALFSLQKNFPDCEECLILLMENGADITLENDDIGNPLCHIVTSSPAQRGAKVTEAFLQRLPCFNYSPQDKASVLQFALHKALSASAHRDVIETLIQHGAPVNHLSHSPLSKSPLMRALVKAEPEVVTCLLDHGADMESSASGITPLFQCVKQACACASIKWYYVYDDIIKLRDVEIIDLLISRGARVNVTAEQYLAGETRTRPAESGYTENAATSGVTSDKFAESSPESSPCLEAAPSGRRESYSVLTAFFSSYRDEVGPAQRGYRSFSSTHSPITMDFLVLMLDKLVTAGAIPHPGDIPGFMLERILTYYSSSLHQGDGTGNSIHNRIRVLWNKLEASGFDLYVEGQEGRLKFSKAESELTPEEKELLSRFHQNRTNPRSLRSLTVICIRTLVSLSGPAGNLQEKMARLPLPRSLIRRLCLEHLTPAEPVYTDCVSLNP